MGKDQGKTIFYIKDFIQQPVVRTVATCLWSKFYEKGQFDGKKKAFNLSGTYLLYIQETDTEIRALIYLISCEFDRSLVTLCPLAESTGEN